MVYGVVIQIGTSVSYNKILMSNYLELTHAALLKSRMRKINEILSLHLR